MAIWCFTHGIQAPDDVTRCPINGHDLVDDQTGPARIGAGALAHAEALRVDAHMQAHRRRGAARKNGRFTLTPRAGRPERKPLRSEPAVW